MGGVREVQEGSGNQTSYGHAGADPEIEEGGGGIHMGLVRRA